MPSRKDSRGGTGRSGRFCAIRRDVLGLLCEGRSQTVVDFTPEEREELLDLLKRAGRGSRSQTSVSLGRKHQKCAIWPMHYYLPGLILD